MKLNRDAFNHAKGLIKNGRYTADSGDWSEHQPSADDENTFAEKHNWADYGKWYLGIDPNENEETRGRFHFPYGDFKRVHRDGVIAAKQRAAQNHYREIEQAADELLEMIDERAGEKA
jgi:hypothetical protein